MMGIVKLACASAVLAAGLVTLIEIRNPASDAARFLTERYGGSSVEARTVPVPVQLERCDETAWPYVAQSCIRGDGEEARPVRRIGLDPAKVPTGSAMIQAAATGTALR